MSVASATNNFLVSCKPNPPARAQHSTRIQEGEDTILIEHWGKEVTKLRALNLAAWLAVFADGPEESFESVYAVAKAARQVQCRS